MHEHHYKKQDPRTYTKNLSYYKYFKKKKTFLKIMKSVKLRRILNINTNNENQLQFLNIYEIPKQNH